MFGFIIENCLQKQNYIETFMVFIPSFDIKLKTTSVIGSPSGLLDGEDGEPDHPGLPPWSVRQCET